MLTAPLHTQSSHIDKDVGESNSCTYWRVANKGTAGMHQNTYFVEQKYTMFARKHEGIRHIHLHIHKFMILRVRPDMQLDVMIHVTYINIYSSSFLREVMLPSKRYQGKDLRCHI